jgi:hypothetical protein
MGKICRIAVDKAPGALCGQQKSSQKAARKQM